MWSGKTRSRLSYNTLIFVFLLKRHRFDLLKKKFNQADPVTTRNPDLEPGRPPSQVLKLWFYGLITPFLFQLQAKTNGNLNQWGRLSSPVCYATFKCISAASGFESSNRARCVWDNRKGWSRCLALSFRYCRSISHTKQPGSPYSARP